MLKKSSKSLSVRPRLFSTTRLASVAALCGGLLVLFSLSGPASRAAGSQVRPQPPQQRPPEQPGTVEPHQQSERLPETQEPPLAECHAWANGSQPGHRLGGRRLGGHRLGGHRLEGIGPNSNRISFALHFQDEVSPYRLISTSVLPEEAFEIEAVLTDRQGKFTAITDGGRLETLGPETWRWHAPQQPGSYWIRITDQAAGETACLRTFVEVPYDGGESLNGYRIGHYQRVPLFDDPAYNRPLGFIQADRENLDTWVSPHFQLSQFLCKQESGFPKYLLLKPRLLLKLEMLLEKVNEAGIEADSFFVMSAYRTPFYNAAIGNNTLYSRHSYGDAADIFIDGDRDGRMDDVDGDGRVTEADARRLHQVVENLSADPWYRPFTGGLGLYGPKPHRGPFIHVDTRGRRARW